MAYLKDMPMIPAVRKFIEFTKETIDIFIDFPKRFIC